ncbi:MAG: class I SAM-dependent methyltransferase [Candidatus Omnitrophota bacterium]
MKRDYLSVVYSEKRAPKTDYPRRLTGYLFDRFNMKEGQRLLEVGCGRGEFLKAFQELKLDCKGVDLSDHCVKDGGADTFTCVDITKESLPFVDNSFDYVYHKSLIEHLRSPERLMKETYRVLKPGGMVIILTPDWGSQMKVFFEDITHEKPYDARALEDALKIYGFKEEGAELFYQLPAIWRFPALRMLSFVIRSLISTPLARKITRATGIKFFRWSVELMVLGYGKKR